MRRTALVLWALGLAPACSVEATEVAAVDSLARLDLGEFRATPWVAMHLQLLFDEGATFPVHGEPVALHDLLRRTELGGYPPLFVTAADGDRTSHTPRYYFEVEDHWGQAWAYRAQGARDRGDPAGAAVWTECHRAFRSLLAEQRDEEPSWMLILGAITWQHLPPGDERDALLADLQALVEPVLVPFQAGAFPACGGMHEAVALALVAWLPLTSQDLRNAILDRIDQYRTAIAVGLQPDGYVEIGGLHNTFFEPDQADRIRVQGHVVEFLSYLRVPLDAGEKLVVTTLRQQFPATFREPREVGEACHAVAALRRLGGR